VPDQINISRMNTPDETVIELIRHGDTRAYEIIMRRYNQRLFRVARSILLDDDAAQDAAQEAYISAFYKLDTFKQKGCFSAWITRIAVNESLMLKRKQAGGTAENTHISNNEYESEAQIEATRAGPADELANTQLASLIEDAVNQLPDSFRCVFVMRAIEQLSVKETADSLGIPEATVKTRFHRARGLIQHELHPHIDQSSMHAFEFAGKRCDGIVFNVSKRLDINLTNSNHQGLLPKLLTSMLLAIKTLIHKVMLRR